MWFPMARTKSPSKRPTRKAPRPTTRKGRRRGKPGRPPLTQTQKVLNAIERGAQDAKAIAKSGHVPILHVHPILSRLRREGRVEGFTGNLRVIRRDDE